MALTEQERKLVEYGKANGKTKEQVIVALEKLRAEKTGKETTPTPQPEEGYLSRVASQYKEAGEKIVSTQKTGIEALSKESTSDFSMGSLGRRLKSLAQTGLQTAGAVAGSMFAPITEAVAPALKATGLDKPIGEAVGAIAGTEPVQQAMEYFKTLDPETQKNLGAMFDIATAVTGQKAISTASTVAPGVLKTVGKAGGEVVEQVGKTAQGVSGALEGVRDVSKMVGSGVASIPRRVTVNIGEKQAEQAVIKSLPTKIAQRAAIDGISPVDVKQIYAIPKTVKPQAKALADTVSKFAKGETTVDPIEMVGKPIVERMKSLQSQLGKTGQKLGEISKTLGVVTKSEVEKPVFDSLKAVRGLEGLTVDKNGMLNFKNTVLTTKETLSDRKAIQNIYSQATKWGSGEAKHRLRQELFEVLGGKKRSLSQITDTQEKAYEAIRSGLSDVLEGKNDAYKITSNEYRKIIQPLQEMRKAMRTIPGATEDVLDMSAGLLARRLTSTSLSQGKMRQILKAMDDATDVKGNLVGTTEELQKLYNILGKYYDIAPKTGFQGQVKSGIEGATGLGDLVTGAIRSVAGETSAVRQKAIEDALSEALGYLPKPASLKTIPTAKYNTTIPIKTAISPNSTPLSPRVKRLMNLQGK